MHLIALRSFCSSDRRTTLSFHCCLPDCSGEYSNLYAIFNSTMPFIPMIGDVE